MQNYVVTVEVELGDSSEADAIARVKRIPFGNNDCDFRIVDVKEGSLPAGTSLYELEPELVNGQNEGEIFIHLSKD